MVTSSADGSDGEAPSVVLPETSELRWSSRGPSLPSWLLTVVSLLLGGDGVDVGHVGTVSVSKRGLLIADSAYRPPVRNPRLVAWRDIVSIDTAPVTGQWRDPIGIITTTDGLTIQLSGAHLSARDRSAKEAEAAAKVVYLRTCLLATRA